RLEITEDLSGPFLVRVFTHGQCLGGDSGKVLGAFHDLQGDRGLDVLGQGDGLVGRPGPAGTLDVGPTQAHALLEVFQWDVQDLGQIGEDLFSPVLHALEFVVGG